MSMMDIIFAASSGVESFSSSKPLSALMTFSLKKKIAKPVKEQFFLEQDQSQRLCHVLKNKSIICTKHSPLQTATFLRRVIHTQKKEIGRASCRERG